MLLALTVLLIVPTTVFAAQKTELPVTMRHQTYSGDPYIVILNKFEVKSIAANSNGTLRVNFDIDYTTPSGYGYLYIDVNCYDASGVFLQKVDFNSYSAMFRFPRQPLNSPLNHRRPATIRTYTAIRLISTLRTEESLP